MSLLYARNVRYRVYDRLRNSNKFKRWLAIEADRLTVDEEEVFSWLVEYGLTAQQVSSLLKSPEAPDIDVGDLKYYLNGPEELVGDVKEGDMLYIGFAEGGDTEFGSPVATQRVLWTLTDSDSDVAVWEGDTLVIPEGFGGGTVFATVELTNVVGSSSEDMSPINIEASEEEEPEEPEEPENPEEEP